MRAFLLSLAAVALSAPAVEANDHGRPAAQVGFAWVVTDKPAIIVAVPSVPLRVQVLRFDPDGVGVVRAAEVTQTTRQGIFGRSRTTTRVRGASVGVVGYSSSGGCSSGGGRGG